MSVRSINEVINFLDSEKEFTDQLGGILSAWDNITAIKAAKEKGLISYEQQDPGTLLIMIGVDEYLIDFNIVYKKSFIGGYPFNEGYIEISFFQLIKNRKNNETNYNQLGENMFLGCDGCLYNETAENLIPQNRLKVHLGLFMVLMERVIEAKNFYSV